MSKYQNPKHPEWFRKWQMKFYNSKQWRTLRNEIRNDKRMRCDNCHKLIKGKSICDHRIEVSPENYQDESITLNKRNIDLLCIECHNTKTFSSPINYDVEERKEVNLF